MRIKKWLAQNTTRLDGKVVVLTGATGGLGRVLCRYLLGLGATLITLDRNPAKASALKAALLKQFPTAQMENLPLDLSQMASVRAAVATLQTRPIDYLVLNAGVYKVPLTTTATGYNNVFQVNFVAPYYLVQSLLPQLRARHGKVVAVGSIAHRYARFDAQDWDYTHHRGASKIYGNAKRWLMFALDTLFQTETAARLAVVHPGVTLTPMTNHYHPAVNWLVKIGVKMLFPAPAQAALSLLAGLFTDCGPQEWVGPRVFNIWGAPRRQTLQSGTAAERTAIFNAATQIYHTLAELPTDATCGILPQEEN